MYWLKSNCQWAAKKEEGGWGEGGREGRREEEREREREREGGREGEREPQFQSICFPLAVHNTNNLQSQHILTEICSREHNIRSCDNVYTH